MPKPKLCILYEDNHLLAVLKPAGMATVGVSDDKPSLFLHAKDYIKRRYNKPGNVYLGVMSRLDAPVTGVVLFARTSKAAARLTEQFRTHAVEKTYWAVVEGALQPAAGTMTDYLGKDEPHHRMRIVGPGFPGAKLANLTYRKLSDIQGRAPTEGWSLVEIALKTGRKHQIRLQFAHHGHPILGDRKYGSRQSFPLGIALHARRLVVAHPVKGERIVLEAPLPDAWYRWGVSEPS
ncbi:MAG: RluA family pseudouridine synthase [Thermoguttaceae bacterium]|jgi:23S rRNA pseudouridine1911/1915/1917 synthase